MKIGLIGSGGREHAIANTLARNRERDSLYVFASHINPGIERLAENIAIGSVTDVVRILAYFEAVGVDFVIAGPEGPLMAGVVDALRGSGIPTVGPTREQARIEGDKAFMRDLIQRRIGWGIPAWRLVSDRQGASDFIAQVGEVAVKPVGLTGGKGVRVMGVHLDGVDETLDLVETWIENDGQVLLEERLVGEEFSRMVFVSDEKIVPMPLAQDFKYAYDGDTGGMTGGMGSYTMADGGMPFVEPTDLNQADRMIEETVKVLAAETGGAYRGFLYGQFMITADGIRLIEYNARLGDPEAINAMLLLQGDAAELLFQVAVGELDRDRVSFAPRSSLCKYLVPAGYPDDPGDPTSFFLDESKVKAAGFSIVFASVERDGAMYRTLGSRTLAIAGLGAESGTSLGEINRRMEALLVEVETPGLRHRQDVGDADVIRGKVARMKRVRAGRRD
jgi:phosphoribosylamine--glycine ligase